MYHSSGSSWTPLAKFTKTGCHYDWMLGATKYYGTRDALTGRPIPRFETVFWNRTLCATITLDSYERAVKSGDEERLKKLKDLGLPTDVKLY